MRKGHFNLESGYHGDLQLDLDQLFTAEGAIINSMITAEDLTGHRRFSAIALPHSRVRDLMKQYNRLLSSASGGIS